MLVLVGGLLVQLPLAFADRPSDYAWFDPIIVVRRVLLDKYVEEPDEEAMQQTMIEAMVRSLEDPYTIYVPPARAAEFNKDLRGTYVGIGAEVSVRDDYLTIVTPLEDSPALEAGVRAGDLVLDIEGESLHQRPIDEWINLLLGEAGTPVTIGVRHLDGTEESITIVRQRIITPTVKGVRRIGEMWDHWLDPELGVGYVRLTQFTNTSVADLRDVLNRLQAEGLRGLVLDLRRNPGGELAVAIQTADLFLRSGVIVSVKSRQDRALSWYAQPEGTLPDFPMVVLINGESASASEIVAGALQENGRARVLGTRTYGKGSVQEVHELPYERGILKLTSGHYYLGSGRNLARRDDSIVWGVDPDPGFVVPMSDPEFVEMIRARQQFEVIGENADEDPWRFGDPDWIRDQLHDGQLASALEAVTARVNGQPWPQLGEDDGTLLALAEGIRRATRSRQHLLTRLEAVERRLGQLQELEVEAGKAPLLPPGTDAIDGTLTLHDRHGHLIRRYRIGGGDLELALEQVRLSPIEPGDGPDKR
jgi:carboxyl-terminal processing protease